MAAAQEVDPVINHVGQRLLRGPRFPAHWNAAVKGAAGKAGGAGRKITEHISEVFANVTGEPPEVEIDIGAFGSVRNQPPAPQIGRQDLQRRVGEHAALLARRELAALVCEPVEALDDVDRLPGFATAQQSCRKADSVKRHVVLAE